MVLNNYLELGLNASKKQSRAMDSVSQGDHMMFYKHTWYDKVVDLIVYVDDIILPGNDETRPTFMKKKLADDFQIKNLGTLKYSLGMEFARSKSGILINQRKYILDMLKETGLLGFKVAKTPIEQNLKIEVATKMRWRKREKYQTCRETHMSFC